MNEISNIEVSVAQMAEALDVSESRVRQLAGQGVVIRSTRGRYSLIPSIRSYVRYRESELNAPEAMRREARAQRDHERWLKESQINDGELVPAQTLATYKASVRFGAEKTFQGMNRILINHLWPKGVKDIDLVETIRHECTTTFNSWMAAVSDMAERGASETDVRDYLFNSHSTPPSKPVDFGTQQTRNRRKAKKQDE